MSGFNPADYEPVESRLQRFWAEHPHGRVTTDLISREGGQWVFAAYLFREGEVDPFAIGYAHEIEGQGNVNKTSACENAETSAIGRALANGGYSPKGGQRPSREEMAKAVTVGPKKTAPKDVEQGGGQADLTPHAVTPPAAATGTKNCKKCGKDFTGTNKFLCPDCKAMPA